MAKAPPTKPGSTTTTEVKGIPTEENLDAFAAAPSQSNAIAERPKAAPPVKPRYDIDDLGTGFEDFTKDDVQVPFLAVLQKNSPQVEEENPKYVQGAKTGMFMNTVTKELFDNKKGILVIPVHRVRTFIEWIPKDDGGGLVNVFEPDNPAVKEVLDAADKKFGKHKIGDGNDLVETFSVFALVVNEDLQSSQQVVISFSSSQINPYKRWMTTARNLQVDDGTGRKITPPMFSTLYRMRTVFTTKNDFSWYLSEIDIAREQLENGRLEQDHPLYQAAREFRAMVVSGAAKADYKSAEPDAGTSDDGDDYTM